MSKTLRLTTGAMQLAFLRAVGLDGLHTTKLLIELEANEPIRVTATFELWDMNRDEITELTYAAQHFELVPIMDKPAPAVLAEALPLQQERVRELLKVYRSPELNGAGELAARMMERALQRSEQVAAAGDLVGMIRAYKELKGFSE